MRMSLSVWRLSRRALGLVCVLSCYLALQTPASALTKLVVQAGSPAPDFGYIDLYVAQKAGFCRLRATSTSSSRARAISEPAPVEHIVADEFTNEATGFVVE
jgi:hypothetical protein